MIVAYNRLVRMRLLVQNAWSDVDAFLKRRADLIPRLVEVVKGSVDFEKGTLESLARARTDAISATSLARRSSAENQFGAEFVQVLAIAESYPQLKAVELFSNLQHDLSETEDLIVSARQYYNACVRDFNVLIEAFPSNLVARLGRFRQAEFFELQSIQESLAPSVRT
jgi:LemA protein